MFGNVLNLSHLAHLLGEDRPFYALQARGLYGDTEPHESFEQAAADYIAEMRQVQPTGPYLVGGFSGGGITAYEIARQLLAAGERIALLVFLDTPLPRFAQFSVADRISMFWQGARAGGSGFLKRKLRERIAWEMRRFSNRFAASEPAESSARQFQSQRIGDAFLRAIANYRIPPVPVDVALFRPRLDIRFRLSGARLVNADREYISEDNGWTPLVSSISVYEVPGDHDGMVLEPNVRVLVSALRKAIASAEERVRDGESRAAGHGDVS
jgi:thioesterase domain-containing protein